MLFSSLVAILTTGAAAPSAPPPVTARFRIDQRLEQEVDASGVGGGKQMNVIKFSGWLTVTVKDSAGGRAFKAVIDSVSADSLPPGVGPEAFGQAKGAEATGMLSPKGKPIDVKWNREIQGMGGGTPLIEAVFHAVKTGSKPGDTWADTSSSASSMAGGSLTTNTITNFKLVGPETNGRHKGSRVDGQFASALAGSGTTGNGDQMDIEGSGTGTLSNVVSADGLLIAGNTTATQSLSLTIPQAPNPIPVAIKSVTNITRLD